MKRADVIGLTPEITKDFIDTVRSYFTEITKVNTDDYEIELLGLPAFHTVMKNLYPDEPYAFCRVGGICFSSKSKGSFIVISSKDGIGETRWITSKNRRFMNKLVRVLLHEMSHIDIPNHGQSFYDRLELLGVDIGDYTDNEYREEKLTDGVSDFFFTMLKTILTKNKKD